MGIGAGMGRSHATVRYPAFRNGFGGLFSTPQADICGGMLASEFAAELGAAAQTSDYAWAKERQGGSFVVGKLLA